MLIYYGEEVVQNSGEVNNIPNSLKFMAEAMHI